MCSPSVPAAPNYAAAAQQTAQGNLAAARVGQYGNMVNQSTPYGNVIYTTLPTQNYINANNQQISADAYAKLAAKDQKGWSPLEQWQQNVTLSPEQQALFDQSGRINKELGNVAESGVQYVQDAMGNPVKQSIPLASGVPSTSGEMTTGIDAPELQKQSGANERANANIYQNLNQIQTRLQDPQLLAQDTTNALYKANTQYLDPQFQQAQSDLENRLANQGITQGSEAYNRAMQNFGNQKQQAYESARNQAISGGINAAQGMFGMNLQGGQFANQALGQQFGQSVTQQELANAAAAQNNQLALANQQAYNQALQNQFGMGMQNAQLNNQVQNQAFAQGLSNAQLQNQASQQDIGQQLQLQQAPVNMLNAVRTGQQLQAANIPQVGVSQPGQLATVSGPDLLSAATAQGQYNQGIYNAQSAANSQLMGSLIGAGGMLGGAGIMKFSDIRLKKNIIKLGIHKTLGIGLYTWDYLWGEKGAGVMAQELEQVMPEAVITMPDGFKAVNYSMLGA